MEVEAPSKSLGSRVIISASLSLRPSLLYWLQRFGGEPYLLAYSGRMTRLGGGENGLEVTSSFRRRSLYSPTFPVSTHPRINDSHTPRQSLRFTLRDLITEPFAL